MIKNIKSKLFLSWVFSYFFILIVPIAMGAFVYARSVQTIKEETTNVNTLALQQIQSVIDSNFEELERMSSNLAMTDELKALASLKKPLEARDILTVREIQKDLSNFLLTNSNIDEIYIYLNNNDFIISSGYKYNSNDVSDVCERYFSISKEELMELSHIKYYCRFRTPDRNRNVSLYICPLFVNSFNAPSGTLIVALNSDRLYGLLENLKLANQGEVFIVNSLNELCGTGNEDVIADFLDYRQIVDNSAVFYDQMDRKEMTVAHIPSAKLDLEYISLVPTAVFLTKVRYIKNMIYIYVLICLVTGGLIAYMFAKRNYYPVKKLEQLIKRSTSNENAENNEFVFLENSLKRLLDEKSVIESRLEKQNVALRNNFISRLLKGCAGNNDQIMEGFGSYKIKLEGDSCLVITIRVDDANEAVMSGSTEDGDAVSMIYLIVRNIGEELFNEKYCSVMADVDGMMTFLVTAETRANQNELDIFQDNCVSIARRIISFVSEKFDVVLSAYVSDVHSGIENACSAYAETLQTLEYRTFVGGQEPVILYFDINDDSKIQQNRESFILEKQRQFGNCIVAGNFDAAHELLRNLLVECCRNTASIQLVKCRVFGLLNTMLDAIEKIWEGGEAEFLDGYNPVSLLLGAKTSNELNCQMESIFEKLVNYLKDKDEKKVPDWVDTVETFVRDHYREPDLSVSSISDRLDISISYLSRMYKKYRGIGLLDYIHKIRLEAAKKIINDSNLHETAIQVGYCDSKALIRVFKKYEGITPGKFKGNPVYRTED